MVTYKALWSQDDRIVVMSWWRMVAGITELPGPSARGLSSALRRCARIEDVILTEAFRLLYFKMADSYWVRDESIAGLACAAGVLAHVATDAPAASLAEQCAARKEGGSLPVVSEIRFSQLQKSRTIDELFVRMRRTIQLLRRAANVLSVADGILQWYREHELGIHESAPRDRLLVRWGLDYFRR